MLKLVRDLKNKKKWLLIEKKISKEYVVAELNFTHFSSIIKTYDVVERTIDEMNNVPKFSKWFSNFIREYAENDYNSEMVLNIAKNIYDFSEKYIDYKNINYSEFVNRKKVSKTSILFTEEDIREIGIISTCLKIYSIFRNDEKMYVSDNLNKEIFSIFSEKACKMGIMDKVFQLIKSKTYRSSCTDRYVWDIVKMSVLETPDSYIMFLFNFIMTNLIATLRIEVNPINYLTSIIDAKLRWLMTGMYKDQIIYGENFGGTEEIYGSSQTKESFHLCCCNDVMLKASRIGINILENEYDVDDEEFMRLRERLERSKRSDPSMKLVTMPIISEVLEIPYKFLLTVPSKHIVLTGVLLYHVSKGILDKKFPILMDFLISCPRGGNTMVYKSSYKLKSVEYLLEDNSRFFGFNSKTLKYDVISPICGILSTCKKNLVSVIDGLPLSSITYSDLENDVVVFYNDLYSGKLKELFEKMRKKADLYF